MKSIDNSQAVQHLRDTHLNGQGMESIRAMGRDRDPEALREVARQFESMFIHQMLKNMRAANEVFGQDNFLNSSETQFHQEMFDQQLSLEMTAGRGLGLADALYQQMLQAYGHHLDAPESESQAQAPAGNPFQRDWVGPAAATGGKTRMAKSPEEFVTALKPYAEEAAAALNVNADVLLAQAALETGWGRHVIHTGDGQSSHNLFNIKADRRWDGDSVNVSTLEYRDGLAAPERADFRRYESYAESFADYIVFLQNNPRYQRALEMGGDSAAYAEELQKAGYATDPEYANKIKRLLNSDAIRMASDASADDLNNEA
ncbi:flagellar assembly peptidoglycan hydrolase FlgJ [Marinimicrobium sp. ABcell2]|uniref:flagellar assembly peptidoglycan hydrolase FlgJ n=1 Tax=Marinimicrobium sp. ABcell2 TaxID=3069751 RepID=UPI0027B5F54E|nr:flagellar assembly peptidoglycan hydrolase FlgJ [Marinimicrobium sp. ABcell2]MDQ2077342.1 flagellar assembly peptidoglycan hydrolase FlgJ [Marinimicrobium sp. ABcell2]